MPSARVITATAVKPGRFSRLLIPYRTSRRSVSMMLFPISDPNWLWWIQLPSATVEFVVAPEERDVYSYERTPKDLAPLGAKPGSGTFTGADNSDCAPTELRSKETTARL